MQSRLFAWVRAHEDEVPALRWYFAVPNGGLCDKGTAVKMKAEGVRPGVLDTLCLLPRQGFHGLAIELKWHGNTLTDEQEQWVE